MKIILRWIISAFAIAVAAWIVPGIYVDPEPKAWVIFALMAVILGFMNAIVRPILSFLSCGFIILTLGLFTVVINAATLWLSSYVALHWFGIGFHVVDFWSALLGAIIISVVSFVLSMALYDKRESRR